MNGIKQSILKIAKQKLKGNFNISLEDNDVSSLYNAEYVLLYSKNNKYVSYEKLYDVFYKSIDLNNINDVIRKYFKKSNMNVCLLTGEHNTIKNETLKHECEKLIQ